MDRLHALCGALREQVSRTTIDPSMILCTTFYVRQTMLGLIADGTLARYKYTTLNNVDLVFEALCLTQFDMLFKNSSLPKHSHVTKLFEQQVLPFWLAGALATPEGFLNVTINRVPHNITKNHFRGASSELPKEFIMRFRTRRYSHQHGVRRQETRQQKVE